MGEPPVLGLLYQGSTRLKNSKKYCMWLRCLLRLLLEYQYLSTARFGVHMCTSCIRPILTCSDHCFDRWPVGLLKWVKCRHSPTFCVLLTGLQTHFVFRASNTFHCVVQGCFYKMKDEVMVGVRARSLLRASVTLITLVKCTCSLAWTTLNQSLKYVLGVEIGWFVETNLLMYATV